MSLLCLCCIFVASLLCLCRVFLCFVCFFCFFLCPVFFVLFVLFNYNRQVVPRIDSVFIVGGGHMYFHRTVRDRTAELQRNHFAQYDE